MTWGETWEDFKDAAEALGVQDTDVLDFIDIDGGPTAMLEVIRDEESGKILVFDNAADDDDYIDETLDVDNIDDSEEEGL